MINKIALTNLVIFASLGTYVLINIQSLKWETLNWAEKLALITLALSMLTLPVLTILAIWY